MQTPLSYKREDQPAVQLRYRSTPVEHHLVPLRQTSDATWEPSQLARQWRALDQSVVVDRDVDASGSTWTLVVELQLLLTLQSLVEVGPSRPVQVGVGSGKLVESRVKREETVRRFQVGGHPASSGMRGCREGMQRT